MKDGLSASPEAMAATVAATPNLGLDCVTVLAAAVELLAGGGESTTSITSDLSSSS